MTDEMLSYKGLVSCDSERVQECVAGAEGARLYYRVPSLLKAAEKGE